MRKVVLRGRDGKTTNGFAYPAELKDKVKFLSRQGKQTEIPLADLKAVFFVRDFQGDPEYRPVAFLGKTPLSEKLWVRIRFMDGEILEGKVQNSAELLTEAGFYLWPSDPDTNNESVFVVKSAVRSFTVLATC
jgi:hypothetical protein